MKLVLTLVLSVFLMNSYAEVDIEPSADVHDALMDAMQARSMGPQEVSDTSNGVNQEADDTDTCLWGGWISTRDDDGKCLPPFAASVFNDPYIANFSPTYSARMRCGARTLYRCNPVLFGKADSGRDANGYCVDIPEPDSALLMTACRQAAEANSDKHLKSLQENPELLAQYITQSAEIAVQCRQGGQTCTDFIEAISKGVKPALSCHENSALFPYINSTLSSSNLSMIDQLTGSLGTEYNSYLSSLLQNRTAALTHNRQLMDQAIAQYSNSDQVRRMYTRLNQNFTVHYNRSRRRVGSKTRGRSVGRCLMYTKMALLSGNFFRSYPGVGAAKNFGPELDRAGFTNLMETPGFEDMTPETAPEGAVIVYSGGQYGHIEVKMSDGSYGSDFNSSSPISSRIARTPIGIYVKIPDTIEGMVEVPNE